MPPDPNTSHSERPHRPQQRERGEVREKAILNAVSDLICEVGYDRMSIDAVASRAQASKMTIYRRWPGKPELVAEMLRCQDGSDGELPLPATGSLRGDLLAALTYIGEGIAGARGPSPLHLAEALRSDPTLRGLVQAQIDGLTHRGAHLIADRAHDRNETVNPKNIYDTLEIGAGFLMFRILLDAQVPDQTVLEHLIDNALCAIVTT